jgi:hypothetical protein
VAVVSRIRRDFPAENKLATPHRLQFHGFALALQRGTFARAGVHGRYRPADLRRAEEENFVTSKQKPSARPNSTERGPTKLLLFTAEHHRPRPQNPKKS